MGIDRPCSQLQALSSVSLHPASGCFDGNRASPSSLLSESFSAMDFLCLVPETVALLCEGKLWSTHYGFPKDRNACVSYSHATAGPAAVLGVSPGVEVTCAVSYVSVAAEQRSGWRFCFSRACCVGVDKRRTWKTKESLQL